ncbi:hypothetical protein [Treponema sp. Marseille-Q4523]|uniref:hypothetical protein n=1 Tax=Treponema sp. Marseille-Q4523 TaxID=2810610 RepID=UPI001961FD3F|nr:hypothetical protein [Treponema sp. Marseille-Q4523]MBM7024067.1 hypothetical protein [Treponema sp. Marseille-Q4523]
MNKTGNAAFKNDENKTASSNESSAAFSIQELVDNTDSAGIRAFLIDVLTDDPMLLQQFKLKMRCGISSDDLKIYKQAIDRICICHADKYGYISYYDSRGFYNELSEFLQKTITEIIDNLHPEENCINEYAAKTWAKYHLEVMRQLNFLQKDIDEYCKKYIDLSDIRKYYVDECIRMKRYEEAIQLLEEGKLVDTGYRGLILAYSEKLKEIYAKTGQREKYKDELWRIVLEYDPGDIDTYKELKTYYTVDEWEEKREIIFKQKDIHRIDHLYAYDGLYDRLLKLALEAQGIYYILEYEDLIKDLAPEKILKRYEEVVREKAAYTSDRGVYQEIADLLKRMKRYPGGKDLVQTLMAEFRIAYRRRPAMMQELNRV